MKLLDIRYLDTLNDEKSTIPNTFIISSSMTSLMVNEVNICNGSSNSKEINTDKKSFY